MVLSEGLVAVDETTGEGGGDVADVGLVQGAVEIELRMRITCIPAYLETHKSVVSEVVSSVYFASAAECRVRCRDGHSNYIGQLVQRG